MNRGWLVVVLVWLGGCSTVEPIAMDFGQGLDEVVAVGDSVVVRTHEGTRYRFVVSAVDPEWLEGDGNRIPRSDIARLSHRQESAGATGFAILGIGLLAYIVFEFIEFGNELESTFD